jgi:hypothetical protein
MASIPTVSAFAVVSLLATAAGGSTNTPTPIYAILNADTFIPLTIPSAWIDFDFMYETAITDYPQEQGAFEPYNKVKRPNAISVTLAKGGSDLARYAWLAAIQQAEANNPESLYTIISPDGIYTDYTIRKMHYTKRQDKGSHQLYLTIDFTEVPQIVTVSTGTFLDTLEAKSGPVGQLGKVFTSAITAGQNALVNAYNFLTT